MKPFHTITIPHDDILKGRLTMDVFAADLWQVVNNRGSDEYKDAETFFQKTYFTSGLKNLFDIVEKRLRGKGCDPIIQLQTPFGGGKTHALIALYHKAHEWKANTVVTVGTAFDTKETLWALLEKQLYGKVTHCSGSASPGTDIIRKILMPKQPTIILIDELLVYVTKAATVKVGDSNLAAQTITFINELTEAVRTMEKVCLVITLPASVVEHYDENAEKLFQKLQKVTGRMEMIFTPVEDNEIAKIIRQRLFSRIDEKEAKSVVASFLEYAQKEDILPAEIQASEYRKRFEDSYPFMPEVIDVLYKRWGSFHTFQRTRGVLRLLSLVVHHLMHSDRPYISLADFDLGNQEIRQELLKHIGSEFNGIIAADISDKDSGAQKVNVSLGRSYHGLKLGTRAATTIFLYSFSGGQEHGATLGEIKRSATTMQNPAPVVAEAVEHLKGKLFYLQSRGDRYFFSNQANLNRILLNYMENVKNEEIVELEKSLLRIAIQGHKFRTYIWEENPANISDSEEFKLVILKKEDSELIKNIFRSKGQTPRVYCNTIFILFPMESERVNFTTILKKKIAFDIILKDSHLKLSEEQRKEIKDEVAKLQSPLKGAIRRLYRKIAIPEKDGFKEKDMGIPTYGVGRSIDEELFEQLCMEGEILEKIAPLVLKEKYLRKQDYVFTNQLYLSALKTPGESRPLSRQVLESSINEGVQLGLFGLGILEDTQPKCRYFKEQAKATFTESEILINAEICEQWKKQETEATSASSEYQTEISKPEFVNNGDEITSDSPNFQKIEQLSLQFDVPKGKISNIMGVMNFLQSKFDVLEISIKTKDGTITKQEIEDKIEETFRQLNIE
ncbi:MAG: ATP-binding protein, partial [Promethearchaeota archaeon]